ncbi:MAG: sensor hybrid histidine kinase [Candidatus Solibacter sp.]|jgi:PAS domain S-box-containing protein|nr:sensor hybrid histidine kinase [Candidatus Solibacter sp.]
MSLKFRRYPAPARYGVALLLVGAAILIRYALHPLMGDRFPFLIQFLTTLAVARFIGFGPAMAGFLLALAPSIFRMAFVGAQPPAAINRFWLTISGAGVFGTVLIWLLDRQANMGEQVASTRQLAAERLEQLSIEVAQREHEQAVAAQLRAIVESSEDAIISKDLDGIICSWNHGAEQLFGYTEAEAIGKPISLVVPTDRHFEEVGILERLRAGLPVKHFETIRQHKDGRPIHVSLTISPVRDRTGNVAGASHIARDITERIKLEEQMRQTQKLESLGVLAGGLAHDFNNLLTGVMGNASLVAEDLGPDSPAAPRLKEILAASDRAALLVRQMLAYAGKGRFVVQRLDLSTQILEIVPLIRTSISPSVQLDLKLAKDLPLVDSDPSQMQQLILNLVINGSEAIEGHGTVSITTAARQSDSELQVVLEVRDNGCGMDDETRARIFDPFFSTKFTGRGLGLAAVLGIIRSHNGSISVDSALGMGSTFTVVLPGTMSSLMEAPPPGQFEMRGDGHVLVVDDEDVVCNMARAALEGCGYSVEVVSDGELAVAAVAAHPSQFDAVLLDLTMPSMGGDEALREIHAIRSDIPVILSSGFSETEALLRFADRGLAGFLQKPYTASALARKMKFAIVHRRRMG